MLIEIHYALGHASFSLSNQQIFELFHSSGSILTREGTNQRRFLIGIFLERVMSEIIFLFYNYWILLKKE